MSEERTIDPSRPVVSPALPVMCRIVDVDPDDWKRDMTGPAVAELWAAGWTIHPPMTFVDPRTQGITVRYLCFPPREPHQDMVVNALVTAAAIQRLQDQRRFRVTTGLQVALLLQVMFVGACYLWSL